MRYTLTGAIVFCITTTALHAHYLRYCLVRARACSLSRLKSLCWDGANRPYTSIKSIKIGISFFFLLLTLYTFILTNVTETLTAHFSNFERAQKVSVNSSMGWDIEALTKTNVKSTVGYLLYLYFPDASHNFISDSSL